MKTTSSSSAFFTSITEFFLLSFRSHLRPKIYCRHVYMWVGTCLCTYRTVFYRKELPCSASASRIDDRFQLLIYEFLVSFLLFCLCVQSYWVLCVRGTSKIYSHASAIFFQILKVVCNKNQGGSGRWQTFGIGPAQASDRWRWRFDCCLILLWPFIFNVFPFPLSKAQSLDDVPMNKKNAANYSPLKWICFLCNEGRYCRDAPCANRQHGLNLLRL